MPEPSSWAEAINIYAKEKAVRPRPDSEYAMPPRVTRYEKSREEVLYHPILQTFREDQKESAARVAMDLKRKLVRPTPRNVKVRLTKQLKNPENPEQPMSRKTLNRIFQTLCYDETIDDPWQYLDCISQDVLPPSLLPLRVNKAKHILRNTNAHSWHGQLALSILRSLSAGSRTRGVWKHHR